MVSPFSADPHELCLAKNVWNTHDFVEQKFEDIGTIQLTEISKKEYKIALLEIRNCTEKVKQALCLSNQENNEVERRKKT